MPKGSDMPGLGERLRQAREDSGLSQSQVAKMLNVHRPTVSEMEAESRKVSAGELTRLAEIYRVSLDWLTGQEIQVNQQLKLAARKLEDLQEKDLEAVMRIIDSFRKEGNRS